MACAWTSRPLMILTSVLFLAEAIRVSCKDYETVEGNVLQRAETIYRRVDRLAFFQRFALFMTPLLISFASHPYEHYIVDLFLYECVLKSPTLEAKNVNAYEWVTSADFDKHSFTPADEASMTKLLGLTGK